MEVNRIVYKWMPIIDENSCTGCGLCVEACGPRSLALADGIAELALPDTCGSEEHCISVCASDSIRMAWLPFTGDTSRGHWADEAHAAALRP